MSICACIVLFNPDIKKLKSNIEAIVNQVDGFVIVDNASDKNKSVYNLCQEYKCISLIQNDENKGIAMALNQGNSWAYDHGFQWIITLDQDSQCDPLLIGYYQKYMNNDKVGILCPSVICDGKNDYQAPLGCEEVDFCLTSASLTNLRVWKEIGGYNEWMFIDFVDNEFCLRVRIAGYRILKVNQAVIQHELGNRKEISLFNRKIVLYNHNAKRNYYYVRNSVYFIRKYKHDINSKKEIKQLIKWETKKKGIIIMCVIHSI